MASLSTDGKTNLRALARSGDDLASGWSDHDDAIQALQAGGPVSVSTLQANDTGVSLYAGSGGTQPPTSTVDLNFTDPVGGETATSLVVNLTDAQGGLVGLAIGMRLTKRLGASGLSAGVMATMTFNSVSAEIRSHFNPGNHVATAYVTNGIIDLMYNGGFWLDMSQ